MFSSLYAILKIYFKIGSVDPVNVNDVFRRLCVPVDCDRATDGRQTRQATVVRPATPRRRQQRHNVGLLRGMSRRFLVCTRRSAKLIIGIGQGQL